MAMVYRGNKRYYYRSVRVGNRFKKIYLGKQEQADAAQAAHKKEREDIAAERADARYDQLILRAAETLLKEEARREGWHYSRGTWHRMANKTVRRQPKEIRRAIRAVRLAEAEAVRAKIQAIVDEIAADIQARRNVFHTNEKTQSLVQNQKNQTTQTGKPGTSNRVSPSVRRYNPIIGSGEATLLTGWRSD